MRSSALRSTQIARDKQTGKSTLAEGIGAKNQKGFRQWEGMVHVGCFGRKNLARRTRGRFELGADRENQPRPGLGGKKGWLALPTVTALLYDASLAVFFQGQTLGRVASRDFPERFRHFQSQLSQDPLETLKNWRTNAKE